MSAPEFLNFFPVRTTDVNEHHGALIVSVEPRTKHFLYRIDVQGVWAPNSLRGHEDVEIIECLRSLRDQLKAVGLGVKSQLKSGIQSIRWITISSLSEMSRQLSPSWEANVKANVMK